MITMQIFSLMGALVYILTARRHYSRSIGTDVRFILFLVGEYDGAKVLAAPLLQYFAWLCVALFIL